MAIKNYTTKIGVNKTVGEIESILASHGAQKILKEYYGDGSIQSISFIVDVQEQQIPFRLPIDLNAWIALINRAVDERKLPQRFRDDSVQSARVGWRVIKDWIDAQLALVETKTVKIEQVFLPYVVTKMGKTLYEQISEQGFNNLQLSEGEEQVK